LEEAMKMQGRWAVLAAVSLVATLARPAGAATSTIGILVFDGFLTSDVTAPLEVFGAAGRRAGPSSYKVLLVSASRKTAVVSEEGLRIVADRTIYDDLDLDVLLVPSSHAMDEILGNRDLVAFIGKASRSASWMASNCAGAWLLAEGGVLDGKRATARISSRKFADEVAQSLQFPRLRGAFE
jgi:transcriptional regulator GlxA family with amidase domain